MKLTNVNSIMFVAKKDLKSKKGDAFSLVTFTDGEDVVKAFDKSNGVSDSFKLGETYSCMFDSNGTNLTFLGLAPSGE